MTTPPREALREAAQRLVDNAQPDTDDTLLLITAEDWKALRAALSSPAPLPLDRGLFQSCADCDRPELCASLKPHSQPCHRPWLMDATLGHWSSTEPFAEYEARMKVAYAEKHGTPLGSPAVPAGTPTVIRMEPGCECGTTFSGGVANGGTPFTLKCDSCGKPMRARALSAPAQGEG